MSLASFLASFLSAVWGLFSIESPLFGLSFGAITVGTFLVSITLRILWPLLGLGGSAVNVALHTPSRLAKKHSGGRSFDKKSD